MPEILLHLKELGKMLLLLSLSTSSKSSGLIFSIFMW